MPTLHLAPALACGDPDNRISPATRSAAAIFDSPSPSDQNGNGNGNGFDNGNGNGNPQGSSNGPQGGSPFEEMSNIFWPSPKASPWLHPEKRPVLPPKATAGAVLALLLSLLFPLFTLNDYCLYLQIAVLLGAGLFLCLSAASIGSMLLILIPCGVLSVFTFSPLLAAWFAALLGASVATALLFSHARAWLILPPVLADCALVFLLTRDLFLTALTLLPVAAGLALAFATMSYKTRVGSICLASGTLAVLAVFLFAFYLKAQSTDPSVPLLDLFRNVIGAFREEMIGWFEASGASFEDTFGFSPYTADVVDLVVSTVIGLIPGVFLILCNVLAFLSQSTLLAICRRRKSDVYVTFPACQFRMSLTSALIFIFCYFASLFAPSGSAFFFVVRNLCLILEPGLCLIGIGNTLMRMLIGHRPPSIFFILATAAMLMFMPTLLVSFMAFIGSWYLFFHALRVRMPRE